MLDQRNQTYSRNLILIHWGVALLIAAAFATIELRELFEKGSVPREGLKSVHFYLGITILALVLVRLFVRAREQAPAITPPPPSWQIGMSHLLHTVLYGFMLVMPILGWLTMSAAGKPIPFGLPALVAESKDAAGWYKELHHLLGQIFYIVIGLHVVAALVHHLALKDNTLKRMMPNRGA
jgi:cytochrome b561